MKKAGIVIIVLILCGVCFYGGITYQKNKKSTNLNGFGGPMMGMDSQSGTTTKRMGNMQSGSMVNGEILSKDDKSITIKLNDGGSKIVLFATSTPITKSVDGAVSDLETGKQVMITGTTNTDGSLNAKSIQLRDDIPNLEKEGSNKTK